jgi:hypothetical protein
VFPFWSRAPPLLFLDILQPQAAGSYHRLVIPAPQISTYKHCRGPTGGHSQRPRLHGPSIILDGRDTGAPPDADAISSSIHEITGAAIEEEGQHEFSQHDIGGKSEKTAGNQGLCLVLYFF